MFLYMIYGLGRCANISKCPFIIHAVELHLAIIALNCQDSKTLSFCQYYIGADIPSSDNRYLSLWIYYGHVGSVKKRKKKLMLSDKTLFQRKRIGICSVLKCIWNYQLNNHGNENQFTKLISRRYCPE